MKVLRSFNKIQHRRHEAECLFTAADSIHHIHHLDTLNSSHLGKILNLIVLVRIKESACELIKSFGKIQMKLRCCWICFKGGDP